MANKKATSAPKKPTAKKPAASRAKSATTKTKVVSKPAPAPLAESTVVRTASTSRKDRSFLTKVTNVGFLSGLIAEFIGTFMLTAVALHPQFGPAPFIMMFTLAALVLVFGSISGAYLNPALAVAAWATRRITLLRAVGYIVVQVLGALLAFTVLNAYVQQQPKADANMFGQSSEIKLAAAAALPAGKEWFVLGAEMLGTFIFAMGVATVLRTRSTMAKAFGVGGGLLLGATVGAFAATLVGGSAVLNPAIALAQNAVTNVWSGAIYIVGTSLAAVIGFALYDLLARNRAE